MFIERESCISPELRAYLDSMPDREIKPSYISQLPQLDVSDEKPLHQVYMVDRLREVGLTPQEIRTVDRALDIASRIEGDFGTHWVTVGEIRTMSDRELMKLQKKRVIPHRVYVERIDSRRILILRALFGRLHEGSEIEKEPN